VTKFLTVNIFLSLDGVGMSACDRCRVDRGGHSVLSERGSGEYFGMNHLAVAEHT
jgi:hypothetical protein